MATPIGMPKIGTTMTEGRVVAWMVALFHRAHHHPDVDALPLPDVPPPLPPAGSR